VERGKLKKHDMANIHLEMGGGGSRGLHGAALEGDYQLEE